MRRYAVTEAPRAILAHELAEMVRGMEHLHPEKPERAEAYRRALQEIEMGAPIAHGGHTEFRVNEEYSSRYGVTEGTRAEMLAELDQYGADRTQQGKVEKAREFAQAIKAIKRGDAEVRVEHIVYRVIEG